MANLKLFLKESQEEFRKVNWPTRAETIRWTFVVIGMSIGVAILLGLMDMGFRFLLQKLVLHI